MVLDTNKKLIFTNLSVKTTDDSLKTYLLKYGDIIDCLINKDNEGNSLYTGFVTYQSTTSVDRVMLSRPHLIDSKIVKVHRAMPEQGDGDCSIHLQVYEIFISGIRKSETSEMFKTYFSHYGHVVKCQLMNYRNNSNRAFGFLSFNDTDCVDKVILERPHVIQKRHYHVRKSIPKHYSYIISYVKPVSSYNQYWNYFGYGLINLNDSNMNINDTLLQHQLPYYQRILAPKRAPKRDPKRQNRQQSTVVIPRIEENNTSEQQTFEIVNVNSSSDEEELISLIENDESSHLQENDKRDEKTENSEDNKASCDLM
ncbi:unnamed protein product [Didymodactylos carnosus]|uniref:RRM domain-containing protein n=1 Tax=Didymodactylos carnosus TaxID=1234261 RepID=A0A813SVI8_9BILA|nr:unnamed protein product [Didymodactylos carnosus]CAF0882872.1 unnamed protein product [Didymodactylos carnosus]CAF3590613.1 unnamed protein product [Didymodactylos carnosus]CAF3666367.1 unnamed protein product [Didymodactylos carnosus]